MARQTVAVIGAGVSGMTAAHILQRSFDVTVFEAKARLGGNADTRMAGPFPADLGFVGFNELAYPNLMRLFAELGVMSKEAVQSADLICRDCEFAHMDGDTLGAEGLPRRPRDASDATWQKFTEDLVRFGTELAELAGGGDDELTLGRLLRERSYSDYFTRHHLYPRIGPWFLLHARDLDRIPARFLAATMSPLARPEARAAWRVVDGGSRTYVERIAAGLSSVRVATPVRSVSRREGGVEVRDGADRVHHFDKAVVAVHPAQALRLLDRPTSAERAVLGAFEYAKVEMVLHTDSSILPSDKLSSALMMEVSCASPRPFFSDCHVDVTKSQHLDTDVRYLKTFNPTDTIDPEKLVAYETYEVPVFTRESVAAQRRLPEITDDVIAWAGAYHGNGFHEAGCHAGVMAAEALGVSWS
ncbi:FAD-dependent oxidoreductase [Streptomyces sp. CB01881]|uniref:NAD(P)/FAD-dependent oxidoreductase n=1 Tax=Streptomyces sp. CB01881 TaxID=2078691 RepID=UPI0013875C8E|nr:FAD-dependent oxidoreductase [Streptomyces sp. CB01881]